MNDSIHSYLEKLCCNVFKEIIAAKEGDNDYRMSILLNLDKENFENLIIPSPYTKHKFYNLFNIISSTPFSKNLISFNINLFDIYKKVKSHKQQDDYTIATVYTAKGLEFETVTLAEEFDSLIAEAKQAGEENVEKQQTLFKCFYVAASRAGRILNNANELSR